MTVPIRAIPSPTVTIVVPAYNEEGNIPAIHKAIRALQDRDVKLARDVIAGDNQIERE